MKRIARFSSMLHTIIRIFTTVYVYSVNIIYINTPLVLQVLLGSHYY